MATRRLVNRVPISTTCKNEIYASVQKYAKENGMPISKITDAAYAMYLGSKGVNFDELFPKKC